MPSAKRECASCHVMWLTDFKREDVATLIPFDPKPVMDTGKQDISSSEPICFSCHDGFVLESRFLWKEGKHAHPVGVKPSDKIEIPVVEGKNVFPLNDDGKLYCGTCHSAHGVDWGQKDAAVFMRVRNEDGKLCMACHKDKTKGSDHGSHPVQVKIQELLKTPPVSLLKAGARFANDGGVVCQSCHRPHAAPDDKLLLQVNDKSQLCGECHRDNHALNMKQAGQKGTHPVNIVPEDIKVPDMLKKKGAKLGPKGEIICQTCHRPHDAEQKTRILVSNNKQDQLCQSCHTKQKSVLNSKHDMALLEPDSKNIKNVSASSGSCSVCHLPHKGTGPKMWARPGVSNTESMAALCLTCHQAKSLAEKHTVGDYTHPVGIEMSRLGHTVNLPAYDKDGYKTTGQLVGNVTCASCHDPHQWNPDHPSSKGEKGIKGNNRNRFLRVANGSDAALCKSCHDDKWEVAGSKHDMRYMAPNSKNARDQKVAESSICGACHLVHNALGPKLWARTSLQEQGTGYIACIGCHNEKGIAKNKATDMNHTHPMDVPVDNLGIDVTQDGWVMRLLKGKPMIESSTDLVTLPLYDHHGKPATQDGRVGCGTCHDPHKWSPLPYTKQDHPKNLEGDADSSFLRIADQGQSQLCINCHLDKEAIMLTPHDLTDEPMDYISQTPVNKMDNVNPGAVRGVCMHCHRPHEAKGPALWSRERVEAEAPIAGLCRDCHKQEAIAGAKLTGNHNHPLGVSTAGLTADPRIPIFDKDGDRTDHGGNVDCASCHDPHQWNPKDPQIKNMILVDDEGDTSNSFLRLPANHQSELCVTCHADKKTIRGTDHDLSVTAPKDKNALQQTRDVSGLCGQCHVPHNAEENSYIWSRALGKGDNPIDQKCRSCHQDKKIASAKNPTIAKHPDSINIWSGMLRNQFTGQKIEAMPAFDDEGKRTIFGKITCASCHDPHRWRASHNKAGTGKNIEGDAETSFLRLDDTSGFICADCHGVDGLFRYKYFHGESTHKEHHMFR